jgi:hypothetical protein
MIRRHLSCLITTSVAVVAIAAGSAHAATNGEKCAAAKIKVAGKYTACRLSADSKAESLNEAADYTKCDSKQADSWQKIEDKYGAECLTSGDQASIQAELKDATDCVSGVLGGNGASCEFNVNPPCPPGGVVAYGTCWVLSAVGDNCTSACGIAMMTYDPATATKVGNTSNITPCLNVLDLLGVPTVGNFTTGGPPDTGCATSGVYPYLASTVTPTGLFPGFRRVCGCS